MERRCWSTLAPRRRLSMTWSALPEPELSRLQGALRLQRASPEVTQADACFPAGPRGLPPPAGQVAGATRRHEPEPSVAAGPATGSSAAIVTDLRLVHRGL